MYHSDMEFDGEGGNVGCGGEVYEDSVLSIFLWT